MSSHDEPEVWIEADDAFPCVPGNVRRLRCFTDEQLAGREYDACQRGQRDLAAKVEALAEEWDRERRDHVDAQRDAGIRATLACCRDDLRALLADALAGNGAEEPASVPVSAREGGNGQGDAGEGERGAERRTAAQEACEHQWMTRGHFGDEWRECFLCGKQEDV